MAARVKIGSFPLEIKKAGFTLIELLIAISILSTLASGALVLLSSQTDKARDAQRLSDIDQLKNAAETYYHDNSCYPKQNDTALNNALNGTGGATSWQVGGTTYLAKVPHDPKTNSAYTYITDATNCPQWIVFFSKLSRAQPSSTCALPSYAKTSFSGPTCVPSDFTDTTYGCSISGNVTCNAPTQQSTCQDIAANNFGGPAPCTYQSIGGGGGGGSTAFVVSKTPGTARNNFSGWAGMKITVGASPISVTALGRLVVAGNTQTHNVKIVNAATGSDVPISNVAVNTANGTGGSFLYASYNSPIILSPSASYYILSSETSGGDQFYDSDTAITTTNVATVNSAASGTASPFVAAGGVNNTFGPVDFKYNVAAGSTAPSVTTTAATNTTITGATLNGTVNTNGSATNYWWRYGTTNSSCSTLSNVSSPGALNTGSSSPSLQVNNLTSGVTYYFCMAAQNSGGTTYGNVLSFNTYFAPIPTTVAADTITATTANLNSTIDPQGSSTTYSWRYGTTNTGCSSLSTVTTTSNLSGTAGLTSESIGITGL
ncbi:MAG TPA: prepilin-type N-terminal cleavage/methylation domain-containing protein, partial [Patescibacteria group bacterium]|nr:prepilin-type N-terminal cleavage/methylation domain-containing protein [Patescibacteria group bacterium]